MDVGWIRWLGGTSANGTSKSAAHTSERREGASMRRAGPAACGNEANPPARSWFLNEVICTEGGNLDGGVASSRVGELFWRLYGSRRKRTRLPTRCTRASSREPAVGMARSTLVSTQFSEPMAPSLPKHEDMN